MSRAAAEPPAHPPRTRSQVPRPDFRIIEDLNTFWRLAGPDAGATSLARRVVFRVRRGIARLLARQETFNAAVVQYINSTLPMVDALDSAVEQCEAASDEAVRYREALAARERRIETAMNTILAAHQELRASVGVLQQAAQNTKREVARLSESGTGIVAAAAPAQTAAASGSTVDALDSHKYVGFEDQFRGSGDDIRRRLAGYMPIFSGATDVLDLGCGRGEFLDLLREQGIRGRGVDINHAMVDVCREKGLDATVADALAYLRTLPDASLGGLFAAQVIEHLEPAYLTRLLDTAFDKLRAGSPIVLETINPACWFAFFESYIRDITHVRPIHPDTLKYLLVATGFQQIEIRYRAPYPESDKLQSVPRAAAGSGVELADWAETLNANVEKINRLLFTYLDYAAVGRRP